MTRVAFALSILTIAALAGPCERLVRAQTPANPLSEQGDAKRQANPPDSATPPSAGQSHPPIVVEADKDEAAFRVHLTIDAAPQTGELEAGLLVAEQNPAQRIRPSVAIAGQVTGSAKDWTVPLKVSGGIPFGDSTAPLLYKGSQTVETLRFHKVGLGVKPGADGVAVARQRDGQLLLVVENNSAYTYEAVRARVRFQDSDVCTFTADEIVAPRQSNAAPEQPDCAKHSHWDSFHAPPASQISLRAAAPSDWFNDRESGYPRTAVRKGILTLRYEGGDGRVVSEQHLPLEMRFEPGNANLARAIFWIFALLLLGSLLSLLLRVSIPNYRRRKALKARVNESRRAISQISGQVYSQLRVLLRVELLALEQRQREGWVLGPEFAETATRVEAGLAALDRKIATVDRLGTLACRRETLLAGPVSPTQIDIIDRNLSAAADGLKNDQLTEPDWVHIQQRLDAAHNMLDEPTQEEKQAFEALLSKRWKSVREFFATDPQSPNALKVPDALELMEECFPDASLLPKEADRDGTAWIDSIGAIRADLQLTALEILRDVQFLAPAATSQDQKWPEAIKKLTQWLATPALNNLCLARRQLLQLAEGVTEEDVVQALRAGQAHIDLDPQVVSSNQTVRMSVRFRDPKLNAATARDAITCEWRMPEPTLFRFISWRSGRPKPATPRQLQTDVGWRIHRYFPADVAEQNVEARFFWNGNPITAADGTDPITVMCNVIPDAPDLKKDRFERWIWRHMPQLLGLLAALLVPLAALAASTSTEGASGRWWELVSLGFGSETIRSILTGSQPTTNT